MKKREITTADFGVILAVAISLSAFIYLCWSYLLLPNTSTEHCLYLVRYLHVSGREIDKKVSADCEGFQYGFVSDKHKIEMGIVFHSGYTLKIQGATDILSVQKLTE